LIGYLDRGELVEDTMSALTEALVVLKQYSDVSGPKAKFKGKVTLEIEAEVQNGMVTIVGSIGLKVPKKPRGTTIFWLTDDAELSTEHPNQHDMFKPKDVPLHGERGRMTS
jgi:hypothetical protein